MTFDEIVESISFDEFKTSFLMEEEKTMSCVLKKVNSTEIEFQTFFDRVQKHLTNADKKTAQKKAKDPLYNIAYFARAVKKMHPGFSSEGIQAGFDTEDFKAEVVKLYEKYQKENLLLTNEHQVNQFLTVLLKTGLTTLQDNHFNIRTSKGARVYEDDELLKQWTRERPLKTRHPDKGNVGENVAYTPNEFTKILVQENMGTEENPKPLIVGERIINNKSFGIVGLSSIFMHWGTPQQATDIQKVEHIIKAFEQHYKNWDGVIIDVRGNTGGDGAVSRKISQLLSGEEMPYCLKATKRKTKEAALREIGSPEVQEQPEWTPKTFQGKHQVYLLTDSLTSSASESFVPMLKHYKKSTIIGENTNGCCQYGGIKPVRLPCGGIMKIGTLFRTYEDGMIECVGHKPDIDCTRHDALQVAFEQIEQEETSKQTKNGGTFKQTKKTTIRTKLLSSGSKDGEIATFFNTVQKK